MPGTTESGSVPQSHAVREPSRIGNPMAANVACPAGWRAWTETGGGSMATGCPSRRYDVGSPGTSVSWYGVNRNAVETVWLHATVAVWPMLMAGTPYSPTPVTLS